jgi:hypothetical protein
MSGSRWGRQYCSPANHCDNLGENREKSESAIDNTEYQEHWYHGDHLHRFHLTNQHERDHNSHRATDQSNQSNCPGWTQLDRPFFGC